MEVIEPLNLSVTKAAKVLGVTKPALSALLNGRASLSPDMALRIEKAFGLKMDTLLRMQTAHETNCAGPGKGRRDQDQALRCIERKPAFRRAFFAHPQPAGMLDWRLEGVILVVVVEHARPSSGWQ